MSEHPMIRPWTARIYELIDAGVHDRVEIIRLTIPFVPEGHAYRMRERINANSRRQRHARGETLRIPVRRELARDHSPHHVHEVGARMVLQRTIRNMKRYGTVVEIDGKLYRRNDPTSSTVVEAAQ